MNKDYKKLYEDALERARKSYEKSIEQGWTCDKCIYEEIFPELRESEDERIRKELINFFSKGAEYDSSTNGIKDRNIIAWLEKQGEQKSWSEEDEKMLNSIIEEIRPFGECPDYPTDEDREYYYGRTKTIDWLKSLKPRWKPTKEQMEALEHFVRSIGESGYTSPYDNNTKLIYSLLNDLKSL